MLLVVGVPLSLVLGLNYGTSSGDTTDGTEQYSLTDKVLLTYSNLFCQELQAQSTNQLFIDNTEATLNILNSPPALSDVEHFNLSETATLSSNGDYHQWNFLLNEGSNVFLNACLTYEYSYGVTFYLIKGKDNFNRWRDSPFDNYEISRDVYSSCAAVYYNVTESDRYYFVLYDFSDIVEYKTPNVFFQFQRSVYHISPNSIVSNCSFPLDGLSQCSVGVPLSSGNSAVLSLNTSLPVDYEQGASISINCQPRAWLYAVIVVGAVVPIVICIIAVCVCLCVCIKRRKNKYHPLTGNNATTGNVVSPHTAAINVTTNGSTAIPAQGYPPASGGYGATIYNAPPPYTH